MPFYLYFVGYKITSPIGKLANETFCSCIDEPKKYLRLVYIGVNIFSFYALIQFKGYLNNKLNLNIYASIFVYSLCKSSLV